MKTYGDTEDGKRGLSVRYLRHKYTAEHFPLEVRKLETIEKKDPELKFKVTVFLWPPKNEMSKVDSVLAFVTFFLAIYF